MPRVYMPQPGLSPQEQRRAAVEAHTRHSKQPPVVDPETGDTLFANGALMVRGGSDVPANPVCPDEGMPPEMHRNTLLTALRYWQVRARLAKEAFDRAKREAEKNPTEAAVPGLKRLQAEVLTARDGLRRATAATARRAAEATLVHDPAAEALAHAAADAVLVDIRAITVP